MKPKVEKSLIWLKKKWVAEQKTLEEMAIEAGCSVQTIRRRLREAGLIK
jgi:hypothetical protein